MQSRHIVLGAAVLLWQAVVPAAHARGQHTEQTEQTEQTVSAPLTLDGAIALALAANPGLRSAGRLAGIADGAVLQAGARPNPELSLSTEGTERNTRTETVQLSQVLELGGKRAARIAVAEGERSLAQGEIAIRRAGLRADVAAAYLEALTAQERLALARASFELARKATLVTGRRVAAGKLSPVEQARSGVAEAQVELELDGAEADLALARRRLAALWGESRPLARSLQEPAPDGAGQRLPGWPELQARLADAPQLRLAQAAIAARDAQVGLERARRIPDLTLSVGSQREREPGRTQGVVGVSVPLPLFDRNQGNLLSALRRADQARDDLDAERLRVELAVAEAWQRADVAANQVEALRKRILPAAQGAYEAAVTGFEMGKFAFTDVLDAQRTLFQTRTHYLRALSDRYRAIAELQRYVPALDAVDTHRIEGSKQ